MTPRRIRRCGWWCSATPAARSVPGADLSEAGGGDPFDMAAARAREMTALLRAIVESPLPVIAAINGHVRAGGFGLVGACDIAVAGPRSTFALTEARIGVAPAIISLTLLPKMSARAAARYYLTGETFDAGEAAEIGLDHDGRRRRRRRGGEAGRRRGPRFTAGSGGVEGADHGRRAGRVRPRRRAAHARSRPGCSSPTKPARACWRSCRNVRLVGQTSNGPPGWRKGPDD